MLWGLILSCLFCSDSNTPQWDTGGWWDSGDWWSDSSDDCYPWISIRYEDEPVDTLDFGTVGAAEPVTVALTILNKGDCDLEIDDAQTTDADAPFSVGALDWPIIAPDEEAELEVTFSPTEAGSFATTIEVTSNDPFEDLYSIELVGELTSGGLEISPQLIDFGSIEVGCEVEETATASNVGSGPVTIESIEISAGSDEITFATDTLPATLESGESLDLRVAYAPVDEFDDQAYLTVTSTDPSNPVLLVTIDAAGVFAAEFEDSFEQEGSRRVYILTEVAVESTIEVRVSGVTASGWSFDNSANAVVFDEGNVPTEGSVIEISYARQPVCE